MKVMNDKKGFTLLEAVLAVLILGIGFFSTMLLIENISISTINTDRNIVSTQLANEKIETIIADKKFKGFSYVDNSHYPTETLSGPYTGYKRKVFISEVQPGDLFTPMPGSGIKRVLVTVYWGNTAAEQVTITGMVSKYN
jgi:type II secretory pathway pseudopilin PulG